MRITQIIENIDNVSTKTNISTRRDNTGRVKNTSQHSRVSNTQGTTDLYKTSSTTPQGKSSFKSLVKPDGSYTNTRRNADGTKSQTRGYDAIFKHRASNLNASESVLDEVTYDDDDKFFEDYGVMYWNDDDDPIDEAEYQGRKVKLGKPMAGDVKKFKVYVKNPKGNVVKVNFGQKGVKIKKSNPARRKSFRARHNCDNPGPRHKARYWSCRKW